MLLIYELTRVREIFTVFRKIGIYLLYRTAFELLIERRTGDTNLLGDSRFRQPLLQERLYFTSLIRGQTTTGASACPFLLSDFILQLTDTHELFSTQMMIDLIEKS